MGVELVQRRRQHLDVGDAADRRHARRSSSILASPSTGELDHEAVRRMAIDAAGVEHGAVEAPDQILGTIVNRIRIRTGSVRAERSFATLPSATRRPWSMIDDAVDPPLQLGQRVGGQQHGGAARRASSATMS